MEDTLQQWATSLTSTHKLFSHDLPLAPHHFSVLVKDRTLMPCLSFLVRHVVPSDQGRLIRLNLKHASIRKGLKEECEEPSSLHEYLRLKTAIADARTAIAAETTEISKLNQQKEEHQQREVEARRKAALMRAAQQDKQQLTQHYGLWSTQLVALREDQHHRDANTSKGNLAVKDKLHLDLLGLEQVHQAIFDGTSQDVHQMKEGVWERIRESVEQCSPRCLVEAVVTEAREGQHSLHSLLQEVDLTRDANNLRVKCESDGTFMDEMNPSGVVESVQELLRQMSAAHVRLYLQAHQENQAAQSLTRALATLTTTITTVAKRKHKDEEVTDAMVSLVKTSCGLAGEHAALACAQTLTATLHHQAEVAARVRTAVKDKHTRITNFEKEIEERMRNIQCLAKSVQGGREAVRQLQAHLESSMREVLSCTTTPTPASTSLASECEKISTIPLAYLLTTHMERLGERKQKISMSTTPLVWHNPKAAATGWMAVTRLCEGMRCWDSVYEAACKYLHQTTSLHRQVEHLLGHQQTLGTARRQTKVIAGQDTKDLLKQVEAHDQKLEEEVTQMVTDAEKQLTQGFQHATNLTRHLSDWWEQPAKKIQVKL